WESGMPEKGFTLEHMASDIEAVLEHLGVVAAHFIAYSRGVTYALQYQLLHPDRVHGLIVGDYAPQSPKLSEEWVNRSIKSYLEYESWDQLYNAISASEQLSREDFEARKEVFYSNKEGKIRKRYDKELPARLQLESELRDLTESVMNIRWPLLVLKGA